MVGDDELSGAADPFRERVVRIICRHDYLLYFIFVFQILLLIVVIMAFLFGDLDAETRTINTINVVLILIVLVPVGGFLYWCNRRK